LGRAIVGLAVALLAAEASAEAPPRLRLPEGAKPVRQSIELSVDPASEGFSGSVAIDLELREPLSVIWLNASGLKVTSAALERAGGTSPARAVPEGDDVVGFTTGSPVPAGPVRLRVAFEGAVSRRDNDGIFAVQEADAWYLFTQFQALAARRAFPCFDEPSYKIPWQLTLRVPRGAVALSNGAVTATRQDGDRDVVSFAETPALPSYLVAFAVGPFDLVDVGPSGRNRTPTRLAVPRGRAADTAWARESTPRLLSLLEDYFDRPYPHAKLDQVAIPGAGFAMEHPGLVTYGQSYMVRPAGEETIASRQGWASLAAHELAHQWFGNLVTMAWWDDTWLNESFASWLGEKVTDRYQPAWGIATGRVAQRSQALALDSLATARRIRQPIASRDDVANAFDFVTYLKGQAVLEMIEAWLGEDVFRRGVNGYVARHAGGNATAAEFVRALSEAAGRDVGPVMASFLDQTGAPVVSASVRCDPAPRLALAQRPYRALGSPAEAKTWALPVCVRVAGRSASACTVLSDESSDVPLGPGACPAWSFANAAGAGYFRNVVTAAEARLALEGGYLGAAERTALAGDVAALVGSGDVPAADAMELARLLARDPDRHVVGESVRLVGGLEPLVPDALVGRFRGLVRQAYGERARTLGWVARPGDSEDVQRMRQQVVGVAATLGRDPELQREAVARVGRWLDDPSALDPELVDTAIVTAVQAGDRPLFARLTDEVLRTSDRARRERLLKGFQGALDPELAQRALALTLDARIDARESVVLLWALGRQRETSRAAFDFLKANYDALIARLPTGEMSPVPYLPWVGARLCSRPELEGFFGERSASVPGAPRALDQVLESVDQCAAKQRAQQPGLTAYLSRLSP
jgi:alanyl aminopeptidase